MLVTLAPRGEELGREATFSPMPPQGARSEGAEGTLGRPLERLHRWHNLLLTRDLKVSAVSQDVTSVSSLFHWRIVRGKKDWY